MAETIKGLNIKLGLDTTELDRNLKEITSELKEEQKDLKAINNALKFDSSNVSLWKDKQDKLNQTLETSKKKLEAQNAKLEEAKKALKIGAISEQEFNALKRSVQYTETDIQKLNTELGKTADKIKSLGSINVEKLGKVGSSMTKYVTAPIMGAVAALSALTVKSMQTADAIADNAAKVYLSVEAYQKWGHAFKILAVDEASMQKAFIKLNGVLGDIATGNGSKYEEYLSQIGLTTNDLIGLNSDQAFDLIRNSLSKLEDETLRVAVANQIFGDKVGAELAQVLGVTSDEIKRLKDEAEALGIVSEKEAETAGKFTDSLDNLKQSFSSLSVTIGIAFLPVVQKVVDTIQERVVPAIRNMIGWWDNLSTSTKKIVGVLVVVLASIGPILTVVAKAIPLFGQLKNVMSIFKGAELFKGLAFGKLAIIGLVAALVVLLLKNERFQELLKKVFDAIQQLLVPIGELVTKLATKLMPVFEILMGIIETVIDSFVELLEGIMDPLIEILDVVIVVVVELMDALMGLLNELLPPIISILKMLSGVIVSLIPFIQMIVELVGTVLSKVLGLLFQLLEPIKTIIEVIIGVLGVIMGTIANLVSAFIEPLNRVLEVLSSLFKVVADVILLLVNILVQILTPILDVLIAILEPILELITVIIEAIASVMVILMPLIDLLLAPLINQLDFIKFLLEAFSPLLMLIGNVIGVLLAPALKLLMAVLEPVLWLLTSIIDAVKWIIENIAKAFEGVGKVFGKVGNFFGDLFSGKLFQSNSNATNNSSTINNLTVNTTSSTIDINALNRALGGAYL